MLFRLEGYDLITNKFKYIDDEINQTVNFIFVKWTKKLLYKLASDITVILRKRFYDLGFLDLNFVFTVQEISKMEKYRLIEYLQDNLNKINNIIKKDPLCAKYIKLLATPPKKVRLLRWLKNRIKETLKF